jgi:hypothetical protein
LGRYPAIKAPINPAQNTLASPTFLTAVGMISTVIIIRIVVAAIKPKWKNPSGMWWSYATNRANEARNAITNTYARPAFREIFPNKITGNKTPKISMTPIGISSKAL